MDAQGEVTMDMDVTYDEIAVISFSVSIAMKMVKEANIEMNRALEELLSGPVTTGIAEAAEKQAKINQLKEALQINQLVIDNGPSILGKAAQAIKEIEEEESPQIKILTPPFFLKDNANTSQEPPKY